jgi:hypothetical protein
MMMIELNATPRAVILQADDLGLTVDFVELVICAKIHHHKKVHPTNRRVNPPKGQVVDDIQGVANWWFDCKDFLSTPPPL